MEDVYEVGLEFIRWLQATYPQLAGFFVAISSLGREEFYLAVLPLIYWCISKRAGRLLGYMLFVTVVINTMVKHALRAPRPFWIDPTVGIEETGGYGIPSGHTQYATTLYLIVAYLVGGFWIWLAAGVMILLMALSRIYLGAHFIHDVVAGFIIGVILLILAIVWDRRVRTKFSKRILGQRMMAAVLVVLVFAALYLIILYFLGEPNLAVPWAAYIPAAEIASRLEMASAIGAFMGYSIGIVFERSRVRFRADGPIVKRAGRYLLGILIAVIIWRGLGMIFPNDPLFLALPLRILRYFLITLWVAYYAPWLFVRLGLTDTDPEPQMDLRL
ncbi:MAG: phosphatase PAP2 family protein [Candidatus Promineifilaceae bacterium]|jgi:membrane-associated phospholipid phosphatase